MTTPVRRRASRALLFLTAAVLFVAAPLAAGGETNPCNPCAENPCNPCADNPCNPCGGANPCNPCGDG